MKLTHLDLCQICRQEVAKIIIEFPVGELLLCTKCHSNLQYRKF